MVLHPEVQTRAQAELDALLGPPSGGAAERLPEFKDRVKGGIPYLEAVVSEILRWNPVTPLGAQDGVMTVSNLVFVVLVCVFQGRWCG
jgi:cytochrome P450